MTWLTPDPGEHPAKRFRQMLEAGETIVAPGVFNGLTALLAKRAGAKALYLSGAAFSASMGMPVPMKAVVPSSISREAVQISSSLEL